MHFFRKQSRKTSFLLGLIVILLICNGFSQEQEIGACEKALGKCMLDNIRQLPNFVSFTSGLAYCAVGYAYCLKYLDK
jgi:hypothetical protein